MPYTLDGITGGILNRITLLSSWSLKGGDLQNKVNPGSLILSAEMMLRHMGWNDAADLIVKGMEGAISAKTVTYDFERLMGDATLMSCSEFGDAMISHMWDG